MRRAYALLIPIASALSTATASATYSIAATDGSTQQVGGAVTSCVGSLDLASVYGSVPGLGVIHAQAQLDTRLRGKNRAVELIAQGVAPSDIIAMIAASSLDSGFQSRQYGVVDIQGRADGFTGTAAQAYKNDQQARVGSFAYSVQGNILTSQKVLDQAAAGFEADGCDLADRLMAALEAGGENGEGDSRCTGAGIPSDAAFIQVDLPGQAAGSWLKLSVSDTGPGNPLPKLRTLFDTWRKTHPCQPAMPPVKDAGDAEDAGSMIDAGRPATPVAGASGRGTIAGSGAGAAAGSRSSAGSAGIAIAGTGGSGIGGSVGQSPAAISGNGAGTIASSPSASSDRGCSVNASNRGRGAFELIVLLGVFAAYTRSRGLWRGGRRRVRARPPDHADGIRSLQILR
ncbi:MAG TPA: DUF1028 domain-containing protein [Polyangiales bacterium]|nr:DUF1028 domain-containing protein [Polyangiales bacterium]